MPGTYARAKGVCLKMWGEKEKQGRRHGVSQDANGKLLKNALLCILLLIYGFQEK